MKKLHVLFKFAIAIATLSITAPVVFSIMLDNKTDAVLTTLTLKREICELMQQQRIAVKRSLARRYLRPQRQYRVTIPKGAIYIRPKTT
jgi:hypothetical protein